MSASDLLETEERSEEKTPFQAVERTMADYYAMGGAFAAVADGLQHAHKSGVIHRDIKTSNLMPNRAGGLRILDFCLARMAGGRTFRAARSPRRTASSPETTAWSRTEPVVVTPVVDSS